MSNLESISITSSRTNHPFSDADQAVMAQVRAMVEPNKGKLRGVAAGPDSDMIDPPALLLLKQTFDLPTLRRY